jgi:hypothetical protein
MSVLRAELTEFEQDVPDSRNSLDCCDMPAAAALSDVLRNLFMEQNRGPHIEQKSRPMHLDLMSSSISHYEDGR